MVAAALTFIIYSRLYELEAAVIFPALSVFQSLRLPFILLPIIFNNLVSVFVSIRRVSAFLDLPDYLPHLADCIAHQARLRLSRSAGAATSRHATGCCTGGRGRPLRSSGGASEL